MNTPVVKVRNDDDFIESASVTAMMRAILHKKENKLKNPDYLAQYFVNDKWRSFLDDPDTSVDVLEKRIPGGVYYVFIRTKYFDDSLSNWIKKFPSSQVVLLGAGFDSRALRFEAQAKSVDFFEVDLKAMLEYKKGVIELNSLQTKNEKHIKYVPTNFQKDDLFSNLLDKGFDRRKPTYFLCEGLSFFLDKEIIDDLFLKIEANTYEKTQVVLDYAFLDYIEGDLSYYGAKETNNELKAISEPHVFGINYEDIVTYFGRKGFKTEKNYTSGMLDSYYLGNKYGDVLAKSTSFFGLTEVKVR